MLPAQVEYWKLRETNRHNLITEAQGWENINLGYASLSETKRHNKESESLGWSNLSETTRHNRVTEDISTGTLNETIRHNMVGEETNWYNATSNRLQANASQTQAAAATKQANVAAARQTEDAVQNAAMRGYYNTQSTAASKQATAAEKQAEVAQQRADTAQYEAETKRAHELGYFLNSSGLKIPTQGSEPKDVWADFTEGGSVLNPYFSVPQITGAPGVPMLPGGY